MTTATTTSTATTTNKTTTYRIDKAHSEVVFQVRHLLTKVRGRFSASAVGAGAMVVFSPGRPGAAVSRPDRAGNRSRLAPGTAVVGPHSESS